jgi:hypothetical protein
MSLFDYIAGIHTYASCIISILCLYVLWLASYSHHNENLVACFIVILGILYAGAIYLVSTSHPYYGCAMVFLSLIFVIAIAVTSGLKKADGTSDTMFLFLGITPMIIAICFTCMITAITQARSTSML